MVHTLAFVCHFPNVLLIDTLETEIPFTNVACDTHIRFCVLFISHLPTWGISNTLAIFNFFFAFFCFLFFFLNHLIHSNIEHPT
jgi:hypothetical protein